MISLKHWRQDARASVVVFLVALPLCLGIALASNAPIASGLISGIVGGLIVGFVSGSPVSVSGPTAGLAVIVATSITGLGSFEAFTLALFISGIIQIIFGFLKGGSIGNYFPTSVVTGMLAAIGIILILKQFPHAMGIDVDYMGDESFDQKDGQNTFSGIVLAINSFHWGAVIVSLLSGAILFLWGKMVAKGKSFFELVPSAVVVVVLSIITNEIFKGFFPALTIESSHLVQLPFDGGVKDFFSAFNFPEWSHLTNPSIYTVALTLAVVSSLESLLSVDAADKIHQEAKQTSKNRELFAQGLGNAISGFLGGLPVTSVLVRTSVNVVSGARTKLATILHGLLLFISVVTIPKFMNMIPLAALAVVLIFVGYRLTKPELYKKMHAKGVNQSVPFVVTIVAILLSDLLVGIFVGMIVGFAFVIRSNMHKSIVFVQDGNHYLIRFYKDVSFLHKSDVIKIFDSIPECSHVIVDGSMDVYIDDDVIDLIEDFCARSSEREVVVELKKSKTALMPLFREAVHG